MSNFFVCPNCHVASNDFKIEYDEKKAKRDYTKIVKLRKKRAHLQNQPSVFSVYTNFDYKFLEELGESYDLESKYEQSQYHYIVCPNCGATHQYK